MPAPDVVNRSLDAIGSGAIIGDFTDGTVESEAARRIYGATLRQLLRAAHWSFARKIGPLLLLGDRTGSTLDPATGQPISQAVEFPWIYCYAWPSDGIRPRWLPLQGGGTVNPPPVPIMPNLGPGSPFAFPQPARFLVSSTDQFPLAVGQIDWDNLPDTSIEGVGLINRRVVLTNVLNANLIYTRLVLEVEMWDSLFAEAMVATLGSRLALPVLADKKFALTMRAQQIAIAKDAIGQARAASANEAGFPKSSDHVPDWIRARSGYGGFGRGINDAIGPVGVLSYGWESMSFGDGSVF